MVILNLADNKGYEIEPLVKKFNEALGDIGEEPKIPFDLAVLMHQLMWSWICMKNEKTGRLVHKKDFFRTFGVDPNDRISGLMHYCFLCIYNMYAPDISCKACPAIWVTNDPDSKCISNTGKTAYDSWRRAYIHNQKISMFYAHQMATIKIRNKKEYDIL